MARRLARVAVGISLSIGFGLPALADDHDRCFAVGEYSRDYLHPDTYKDNIETCTRYIAQPAVAKAPKLLAAGYNARASWKTKSGDLDAALVDYDQSVKLDPRNVETYDYRADVWKAKGDLTKAIDSYSQAIRVDSAYAAAYYSRGTIYQGQGDVAHARVDYNAALAAPTRNRIAAWAQRNALLALGKLDGMDEAIATLTRRLDKSPDDTQIYYTRGQAYAIKGDSDHAIADFSELVRRDPKYMEAYRERARIYRGKGDRDRAIADFSEAIRLLPSDAGLYEERGNLWSDKGDHDHAIVDFSDGIQRTPSASLYNERCWERAVADRDLQQGLADCNESLRLHPDDPNVLNSRGLVQFKLGAFDRAIADYDAAIALNPKDANSLYARGVAKLKSGNANGGNVDVAAATAITANVAQASAGYGIK